MPKSSINHFPGEGAYDAPPAHLVGWGEGYLLLIPTTRRLWRLASQCLRRFDLGAGA